MLEIWLSFGYILLVVVVVFSFLVWRAGSTLVAVLVLVVGIPLWFGWEFARPTWTTGIVSGTEVRRSDAGAGQQVRDIQYIYMRNQADAGLELENEDTWWWFKRNSERVFNNAKTAEDRKTEVTVLWNRWRSQLFSWHPNVIALRDAGYWPFWSLRVLGFYGLSIVLWFGFFWSAIWLYRRTE